MPAPIKTVQRTLDDMNETLLANVRVRIETTHYTVQPNGNMRCQMSLTNGLIVEGYAVRSKDNDGKTEARRKALKQVILIEQFLAAERLYMETADSKDQTIKLPHIP